MLAIAAGDGWQQVVGATCCTHLHILLPNKAQYLYRPLIPSSDRGASRDSPVEGLVIKKCAWKYERAKRYVIFFEGTHANVPPLDKLFFKASKSHPKTYEAFWRCFDEYSDSRGGLSEVTYLASSESHNHDYWQHSPHLIVFCQDSFTQIVQNIIEYFALDANALDYVIDSFYSGLKQWLQLFYQSAPGAKEKLDKSIDVHKQEGYTGKSRAQEVMDNLPRLSPLITHAIHRFLDKDNDGSVSREEIEDLILLLIDFKEFGPKIFQIEDKTDHAARDLTEFISDLRSRIL